MKCTNLECGMGCICTHTGLGNHQQVEIEQCSVDPRTSSHALFSSMPTPQVTSILLSPKIHFARKGMSHEWRRPLRSVLLALSTVSGFACPVV